MTKTVKQNQGYGDQSIRTLKGADRVRLKPSVIFGSEGIEGCEHSFLKYFPTLSMRREKATVKL